MTIRYVSSVGYAGFTVGLVNLSTITSDKVGALEEAIHVG
jgi:hypothetical protein